VLFNAVQVNPPLNGSVQFRSLVLIPLVVPLKQLTEQGVHSSHAIQLPSVPTVAGHGSELQEALCVLLPLHELPPPEGDGLVQVRDLYFRPPPQVTVHEV